MDTAYEENEVLRNRLGLSVGEEVDLSQLRHRKNVEIEQLRAVNRELDKQVKWFVQYIVVAECYSTHESPLNLDLTWCRKQGT